MARQNTTNELSQFTEPTPHSGSLTGTRSQPPGSVVGLLGLIYVVFAVVVTGVFLGIDAGPLRGAVLLAAVLGFHAVVGLKTRELPQVYDAWRFLLPLSVLMILPDWVLSTQVGSLGFRDHTALALGPVPLFMGGAWAIALLPVLLVAESASSPAVSRVLAVAGALVTFGASEMILGRVGTPACIWYHVDTWVVGPLALYPLPAQGLLGWTSWEGLQRSRGRGWLAAAAFGVVIMALYTVVVALTARSLTG